MKRILISLVFLAALLVMSCTEKPISNPAEEIVVPAVQDTLSSQINLLEFDCNSNQYTFAVNANCDYKVVIPVDWISQVNTKAVRTDSVTLIISPNKTYYPRNCDILIQTQDKSISYTIHITQEEGFNSLAKALKADKSISLFYQALVLTGMIDSIRGYIDETFVSEHLDKDMVLYGGSDYRIYYNDYYLTKYTVFCEKDSMLQEKHNIQTLADLTDYSKKIYDESFPADAGKYDNDYTNPRNPLNRFVSYHILPMGVSYEQLNPSARSIKDRFIKWNEIDFEDFYSPMLEHSVLKISTPYQSEKRYLNRKGTTNNGIEIAPNCIEVSNGYVFYISDILSYNRNIRTEVLNTRIRVLSSTLFPEIMSNGARDYFHTNDANRYSVVSFNDHYKRSFVKTDSTLIFLRKPTDYTLSYMGEEILLCSQFDISFKLPSVPVEGLYEIRYRHRFGNDTPDEILFYVNEEQCGSLKQTDIIIWDSLWRPDYDLDENDSLINACDDSLRAHRFMKDVASYARSIEYVDETCRDYYLLGRYIVCSDFYMEPNNDYYLRIQRVDKDKIKYNYQGFPYIDERTIRLDMLEIVPKHVYDGSEREDKY